MAVIGTFGSFTTARLGIYASQASLQVTGNNIANINTKGYTRQRADLFSLNSTGVAKYANPMGVDIGYGVLVKSVNQLRDPFLDIRFRNENTKLGAYNATLSGLNKLSQTLDEVLKGGESENGVIENALQEFLSALEDRDTTMGAEEYDSLVREAAKSMVTFFNTASKNLQTDWDNQVKELHETVDEVNKCLTNIRDLNEQIRKQGIYGDNALELRDARNLYIDELSQYLDINVEYSMEKIDQYTEIEKLTISLKNTKDPNLTPDQPIRLVDGLYAGKITIPESFPKENPLYNEKATADTDPAYYKYIKRDNPIWYTNDPEEAIQLDNPKFLPQVERLEDKFGRVQYKDLDTPSKKESVMIPLSDTDLFGALQSMRELLTEEGEFASKNDIGLINDANLTAQEKALLVRGSDPNANIKKGIPYYQKRLDALAKKFAEMFNDANQLPATTVYQMDGNQFIKTPDPKTYVQATIKDKDGNDQTVTVTEDMVTTEVEVTNSDGTKSKVRVPLDSPEARAKFLEENPNPTEEQIEKYNLDIANAARCLEALRDQGQKVEGYEYYDGGVLFSNNGNNNDASGITAGNISISNAWASRVIHTLRTKQPDEPGLTHTSRSDNIDHMINLFSKKLDYSASEVELDASGGTKKYFSGSFQEMYTDIGATLGGELSTIMSVTENYELMTLDLDNDRISVSGVDLNDEATSMMQFQKSYQAACRLLTTIDSMLDTLINNTIR